MTDLSVSQGVVLAGGAIVAMQSMDPSPDMPDDMAMLALMATPFGLMACGATGGLIGMIMSEPERPLTGWSLAKYAAGRLFSAAVLGLIFSNILLFLASAWIPRAAGIEFLPLARPAAAMMVGMASLLLPSAYRWARTYFKRSPQ